MPMRLFRGLVAAALIMALCSTALAQGDEAVSEGAKVDKKVVEAAVKKACDWLKNQQKADGSWTGTGLYDGYYPYASTAFVLFALLKGTEGPDSKYVKDGFAYLKSKEFPGVYGVSALILALCALYEPPPPPKEEMEPRKLKPGEKLRTSAYDPVERQAKKKFQQKAPKWVKDWLEKAVRWLLSKQTAGVWRYPGDKPGDYNVRNGAGGDQDASNAQYAMLALHAAGRLGVHAPSEVYVKVANYFLAQQEKDGPDVKPPFPVPAADLPIKKLKELEKRILKKLRKEAQQAARKDKEIPGLKELGPRTTSEIGDPYREFGAEISPMKARGWSYLPAGVNVPGWDWANQATGSMTTSGIASLVVCKAKLEGSDWHRKHGKELRQAIRDGMGWLSHHFTVTENPNLDVWKYYYLYGLERCGVLCLTRKIGEHFWYEEGAKHILGTQGGDGSWPGDSGTSATFEYGPTWPTCFCILFLKKATAPVVRLPEDIYTGKGLFGPNRLKEK